MGEHPGIGEVGCEVNGLLGGVEGVGRFAVALQGQCQAVVNVRTVGKPLDGLAKIVDSLPEMPQRQVRPAAEIGASPFSGASSTAWSSRDSA